MNESGHRSPSRISPLRTSDKSIFAFGHSSSTGESIVSPRFLGTTTHEDERHRDERYRDSKMQDVYKFYETLSEKNYEMSMTDLVIPKPFCTTEGLPIEDNRPQKSPRRNILNRLPGDERIGAASTERNKFSWRFSIFTRKTNGNSPDRSNRKNSSSYLPDEPFSTSSSETKTSGIKASATDFFRAFSRSLSSKSNRTQSVKTSPKVTPMNSPRSSSASAMSATSVNFKSLDITVPPSTVRANASQKNPGVRMDANNQCSVCSSYTQFFKARCQVCGRIYCSNCMQEEVINMPDGAKCKRFCAERQSKRGSKTSASACWPFGFRTSEENEI